MSPRRAHESEGVSRTGLEVAVVGLSGRFPGSGDVAQFWESIVGKRESISRFTLQELRDEGIPEEILSNPRYVPAAGIVANKEYFDPQFFGYSPNEARLMDPQLRIFLECVWESLEHAGYDPFRFGGKIGLYAGCSPNLGWELLVRDSELHDEIGDYSASLIADRDLLTQHVSYRLNLRGPSVNLQTACSTSLVAVHLAMQGLLSGDCEMAVAGGVSVSCLQKSGYLYQPGMILSPDGHCRAFDERAAGTVFGEGAGVVVLKLLDEALASGDRIHAIIRSSAINNDGREKVGFTATSVGAQVDLIRTAQRAAGIDPADISFVEAHGSGTSLGDPIEVDALGRVFGSIGKRACAIGTVKTNVGHLNRAAGIAGLIKTVMALNDRIIPPQLHFSRANPEIDLIKTPFYVSTEATAFTPGERPVVAGVSSFGLGGTNAHLVIEEPPTVTANKVPGGPQLIVLSAKSATALDQMTDRLADALEGMSPSPFLADVAFTLREGRAVFDYRRVFVASSTAELVADARRRACLEDAGSARAGGVVFTFPGLGAQHRNMGRALYERFPGFRRLIDECLESFRHRIGWDLRPNLYPDGDLTPSRESMAEMRISQPALFVVQYSLARFLIETGIRPAAMIGYSFGEYVAACLAGVLSLESALSLAAFRGELMDGLPEGGMLSVPLSEASIVPRLWPGLSLAAINGPSCIVSGEPTAVRDFEQAMAAQGLLCMPVKTRIAGHCKMPSHVTERLWEAIHAIPLSPVTTPYISSLTGKWLPAGSTLDADYWVEHMISPVRFYQGIELLAQQPNGLFVEVGAGRDLTLLTGRVLQTSTNHSCINLIPPAVALHDTETYALKQLGRLWAKGFDLRWDPIFARLGRQRVPLPTYPFQRQAYWPQSNVYSSYNRLKDEAAGAGRAPPDEWGYVGTWQRAECIEEQAGPVRAPDLSIVFMDDGPLGSRLVEELGRRGGRVVRIRRGSSFAVAGIDEYVVDPVREEDYADAIKAAVSDWNEALTIFHLWQVDGVGPTERGWEDFVANQFLGYFSLQFLVRALGRRGATNPVDLIVVSDWLQNVLGDESTSPAKTTVLGAVQVIRMEHPHIRCRSVDINTDGIGEKAGQYARMLIGELSARCSDTEVAHRRGWRWVRTYVRISLPLTDGLVDRLKPNAAYLITGGMGGMGLVMAKALAERKSIHLILTGRSQFPLRSEWSHWLETHGLDDSLSRKIVQLREIETLGSKVWVIQADCADQAAMIESLEGIAEEVGEVLGVIHAAGVTDGALVQRRSVAGCLAVMKSKIQGLYVLQQLFPVDTLDFFVACSSIGSVMPSIGQIAYSAANIFLDRWAAARTLASRRPCWSIGWDIWTESGMGRRSYLELKATSAVPELVRSKESALRNGITDREGAEIFTRVLAQSAPHIVVSTKPLDDAVSRQAKDVASARWLETQDAPPPARHHSRYERLTPYRAPETEPHLTLCRIWAAYFGVEEVGLDDDFFELGGDSLKANVVLRRIHKELGVFVSLAAFYENSRVDTLAKLIDRSHKTEHSAIPCVAPSDFYELSHAQFRLWLLQEHGYAGPAYNRSSILKLRGPFDLKSYRDSLRTLTNRHESLRTAFVSRNGVPAQSILTHLDFSIVEDVLTGSADLDAEVLARVQGELTHTFDLAAPPLFRVRVLRIANDEVMIVFTIHHIICDERSIHLLHREWATLYNSSQRDSDALPSLPIQYKDYAAWNNLIADGTSPASESPRAFWQRYLTGELPQTTVPVDKERPSTKTYRGENVTGLMPLELTERLLRLAHNGKLSTFMALAALVEVLLHRYTGDEDLVLGTAVSGRDDAQLEDQVGFYVNTLPLRYRIRSDLTFRELLASTKAATLAAFEYQNYPFDKIVENCKPTRDPSRNPLFEILILLHPSDVAPAKFDGLQVETISFPSNTSLFDLTFNFRHEAGEIRFAIEYNPDLYSHWKIEMLGRHLENATDWLTLHPDAPLRGVIIGQPGEDVGPILRRREAIAESPLGVTIPDLFERRVIQQPHVTALISAAGVLTYQELNDRANRMAHYLADHFRIAPDCRVGVCLERSENLVVAILAVLKTGGSYVPIDPDLPERRIRYLLEDSGAVGVIIDESNERLRTLDVGVSVVTAQQATSPLRTDPRSQVSGSNLAYVAYTSGSTGRPKGVMIEHRNVVNYLNNCVSTFGVTPQDTVYGLTAVTFDISVMELLCSLLIGARLVLERELLDMDVLAARIREEGVTVVQMTPSRLHAFLERNSVLTLSGVKILLVGGEALSSRLIAELQRLKTTRVFHVYGPTETTIWSSGDLICGDEISLGQPLAGEEIFIVSEDGELMPMGFPGEICIAGEGVGRGYLNQPTLTAKHFVSFPFLPGKRAYRTGDLGQITMGDHLKFLGRNDAQVKIQGVRVETGEIENQLLLHPDVKDAVILARNKESAGKGLWAYVVSESSESELRRHLVELLPYYMVPEAFVFLKALPLTANGKTDRQALLAGITEVRGSDAASAQVSDVEDKLIEIWCALLKEPRRIGVKENFFVLGGNSLKAVQMMARIETEFRVALSLKDVFTGPTIAEIARLVEAAAWAVAPSGESCPGETDEFLL